MAARVEGTLARFREELLDLDKRSLLKVERPLRSAQGRNIRLGGAEDRPMLNMCANNYLGLADDPRLVAAARNCLDEHGFGMASVRFICGTHTHHRALEHRISRYLRTEDTILFSSCFDANAGLFEALLDEEDVIASDAFNHASIIDGIRLSKARRYRYANNDTDSLASALAQASGSRTVLIATDGVFSMDGVVADLPTICDLAERHGALVMVDDSHAVGFIGEGGRGTPSLHGVADRVHILTGTFGKALGGASGGYVSGKAEIVQLLRQRARPYLFSNSLMPAICAASLSAIDLAESGGEIRERLQARTRQLRHGLMDLGYRLGGTNHPIVPVLLGDGKAAVSLAASVIGMGIFVTPFSYPVVPQGRARIRMQASASHTEDDIAAVIEAFEHAGRDQGLI